MATQELVPVVQKPAGAGRFDLTHRRLVRELSRRLEECESLLEKEQGRVELLETILRNNGIDFPIRKVIEDAKASVKVLTDASGIGTKKIMHRYNIPRGLDSL